MEPPPRSGPVEMPTGQPADNRLSPCDELSKYGNVLGRVRYNCYIERREVSVASPESNLDLELRNSYTIPLLSIASSRGQYAKLSFLPCSWSFVPTMYCGDYTILPIAIMEYYKAGWFNLRLSV